MVCGVNLAGLGCDVLVGCKHSKETVDSKMWEIS